MKLSDHDTDIFSGKHAQAVPGTIYQLYEYQHQSSAPFCTIKLGGDRMVAQKMPILKLIEVILSQHSNLGLRGDIYYIHGLKRLPKNEDGFETLKILIGFSPQRAELPNRSWVFWIFESGFPHDLPLYTNPKWDDNDNWNKPPRLRDPDPWDSGINPWEGP